MFDGPECFRVTRVTRAEHTALKMLRTGEADAYQQKLALQVIVNKFCRTHDIQFIPGSPDESAFISGRAFPGQQILKHLTLPVGQLKEEDEDNVV